VKILVETYELHLVPADPNPQPKPAALSTSRQAACLATSTVCRWGRMSTCVEKPILVVHPLRNPNRTKGSWKTSAEVFRAPQPGRLANIDPQNMIGGGEMIVAAGLRCLRKQPDRGRIAADIG